MIYQVIESPQTEVDPRLAARDAHELVDYMTHPAYRSFMVAPGVVTRLHALLRFISSWVLIKIKRAIRYEMIPLHVRRARGLPGVTAKVRMAFSHFANRPTSGRGDSPGDTPLHSALRRDGCAVVSMPGPALQSLAELSRPLFDRLEARREQGRSGVRDFEASRFYARRDESAALFAAVERVLGEAGVFATAERYLGHGVSLVDVNPQINDPSDDFWQRVFPDLQLGQPSCAYLHRDASGGDIKAIIYMSDVDPDNGPFAYVRGSHRMKMSVTDDHIAEANDSNGLAGTDPASRRLFAALPSRLRQKGSFGNDVPDGSPLADELLGSLWSITAPRGSVVVFDTKGVHRGGMVVQGERRVITCVIG
jgi:hypothetical protein